MSAMGYQRQLPDPSLNKPEVALDGQFAKGMSPALKWELKCWVTLPVVALGIAGLMAILVALMRVPGAEIVLPWLGQSFFEKGLIAHVTFAFVIWYLGVQGALTVMATGRAGPTFRVSEYLGKVSVYASWASFTLILAPVLANLGEASANNYIPVLIHPLFFVGLALLAFSLLLLVLRLCMQVATQRTCEPVVFGVAASGVIFLIALICLAAAWVTMPERVPATDLAERLFWGMGHIMQFDYTLLLLCGFFLLCRMSLGQTPVSEGVFKVCASLFVAGAAIGPLFYLSFAADDPAQVTAFTGLYWYVLPWPTGLVLLGITWLFLTRALRIKEQTPEVIGLWVALVLFGLGGIIGFFESSVDTRTPAHYHAELIGVTLVFMCLYFALFFPLLGLPLPSRRWRLLSYISLGTGQFFHSTGLFIAGLDGVARKVAGSQQGLDSVNKLFSMTLMGVGGLIAILGGVIFVIMAVRCLLISSQMDPLNPDDGSGKSSANHV